jgi:hypothetical protein
MKEEERKAERGERTGQERRKERGKGERRRKGREEECVCEIEESYFAYGVEDSKDFFIE